MCGVCVTTVASSRRFFYWLAARSPHWTWDQLKISAQTHGEDNGAAAWRFGVVESVFLRTLFHVALSPHGRGGCLFGEGPLQTGVQSRTHRLMIEEGGPCSALLRYPF